MKKNIIKILYAIVVFIIGGILLINKDLLFPWKGEYDISQQFELDTKEVLLDGSEYSEFTVNFPLESYPFKFEGWSTSVIYGVVKEVKTNDEGITYAQMYYLDSNNNLGTYKVFLSDLRNIEVHDLSISEWELDQKTYDEVPFVNQFVKWAPSQYSRENLNDLFVVGNVVGVSFFSEIGDYFNHELCITNVGICSEAYLTEYYGNDLTSFTSSGRLSEESYIFPRLVEVILDE